MIATAVLEFKDARVKALMDPLGTAMMEVNLNWMLEEGRKAGSVEGYLLRVKEILGSSRSFQDFLTPKGRVRQLVEPHARLLQMPALTAEIIEQIESRDTQGDRAVGLALRNLLDPYLKEPSEE